MAFSIPENTESKFNKPVYFKFSEGDPTLIQFLDEDLTWFFIHTIRTSDIPYLKVKHTEDCPICQVPEWRDKYNISQRFRVNVVDITPEKVCPKCQTAYNVLKGAPSNCRCGANIEDVGATPRNVVKIMENGINLARKFNTEINGEQALNPEFDRMRAAYLIRVSGRGLEMEKSVTIRSEFPYVEGDFEPFDLDILEFSKEEIHKLLSGTSLSDVLKARNNSEPTATADSGKLDFSLPGLE